jgi:hypothetical protein
MKVTFIPTDDRFGKYSDRFEFKTVTDCFSYLVNRTDRTRIDLYLGIHNNDNDFYPVYLDDYGSHYNCQLERIGDIHIEKEQETDSGNNYLKIELSNSELNDLLKDEKNGSTETLDKLLKEVEYWIKRETFRHKPLAEEFHRYKHYKTGKRYFTLFMSEAGDKESKIQYVNYISEEEFDSPNATIYTRTLEDFTEEVKPGVRRFEEVKDENKNN